MNTFSYHASGYELSGYDRSLIEDKLQKLVHLWGQLDDASSRVHIEVERDTRHQTPSYRLAVQLTIPRHSLRAEASGATLAEVVDEVEGKFRKQLERLGEAKAHEHHASHREVIA